MTSISEAGDLSAEKHETANASLSLPNAGKLSKKQGSYWTFQRSARVAQIDLSPLSIPSEGARSFT